jgi:hypothetical protein
MYTAELIQNLLEKYWEGESSLEEERILKAYFNSADPDPRFKAEAALFRTIRTEQSLELHPVRIRPIQDRRWQWAAAAILLALSAGFWWWPAPTAPDQVPVAAQELPVRVPAKQEQAPGWVQPSVQETLVASVAPRKKSRTGKRPQQNISITAAERAEAEVAMAEIKSALSLLSGKISRGRKEAAKGLQEIDHIDIVKKDPSDS